MKATDLLVCPYSGVAHVRKIKNITSHFGASDALRLARFAECFFHFNRKGGQYILVGYTNSDCLGTKRRII